MKKLKPLCLVVLLAALVYGLVLPFCWGNDPADTHGTLSLLCEKRVGWFWLWAVLTGSAFALNLEYLYHRYDYRGKLLRGTEILALCGMLLTSLTLDHSIADWNTKRVLHWIGAILYAAGLVASLLLFLLFKAKAYKRFLFFTVLIVCTVLGVLVQLATVGRNGYMEIVPIAILELTLLILNYTPLVKPRAEDA